MVENPQELWQRCMEFFRSNVNEQQYQTWFVPTKFNSYNNKTHVLSVCIPSHFYYEYLEQHFRKLLHVGIFRYFGENTKLTYKVKVAASATVRQESDTAPFVDTQEPAASASPTEAPGLVQTVSRPQELDSQLNSRQNFDNFIAGISNRLPREVGISIAMNPEQQTFNPLFIFGPSGVGKTHLVNAIGTKIKELHPEKRVLYVSAHLFQVQYTDSVRRNTVNDFIHFYQSIDTLIIDDIQEIAAVQKTQYTFFHIFNHLHQNGRQIILTSDRHPGALMGMEERLLTRFKWGLMAELEKPEEKLRKAILANKIHHDGLNISPDVIEYIAHNVDESVRELEGVVHSLLANSIVFNKDVVDLDFAKRILSHGRTKSEARTITLDRIIEEACTCCNIRQEDVYGKSRKANIVEVRQMSMYLAQKYTTLSNSRIGVLVGNRNHATVCHAIKNVEHKLKVSPKFQRMLSMIEDKIKGK